MTVFTEENVEAILTACGENAAALAESLSQCFDRNYRIQTGDSGVWSAQELPAEYRGPGILAVIQVESQALAVLIPETLPLPEWSRQPDDGQAARLDTLAKEWSKCLLPTALEAGHFKTLAVDDLAAATVQMQPADWAPTLTLQVFDFAGSAETPVANLLVVWPFEQPNFAPLDDSAATATPDLLPRIPARDPLARLRHLPVQVSVRLAEKKIPMSQLLGITPGMLITFNKSCDDLLELYVNNSRYCRGEAVKIGENFGLKINQVGVQDEQQRKVIDA